MKITFSRLVSESLLARASNFRKAEIGSNNERGKLFIYKGTGIITNMIKTPVFLASMR